MTAEELQRLIDRNGLTQVGVAEALGMSDRQLRRYCSGENPIPTVVEYAVRWMLHLIKK